MHDGRNDFNRYMNKPRYKGSIEKVDRIKELEKENERLHDVIRHLTRELDEAEQHAFALQEKLSTLLQTNMM